MKSLQINNILLFGIFISFAISFFNKPPIYPLFAYIIILVTIMILPILLKQKLKILKIQYILFLISFYQLYLAFISGISIKDVINYDFLRHDGNFYVTYFPLMILPFVSKFNFSFNLKKIIKYFVLFQGFLTFGLILYICITNFSCEERCNVCHFLFEAHNAAGGYYMIMTLFTFFYWKYERRRKIFFFIFLFNLYALILTFSRGSIIGLFFAFLYYFYNTYRLKKLTIITNISIAIVLLFIYYIGYSFWLTNPFLSNIENQLSFYKSGTIVDRVFNLWPRAIDDFLKSPLIGIGFSRYDDPYNFSGICHFICLNTSSIIRHTDAHAHNSFLHILAETGLIGLFLFINLFREIFKFSTKLLFLYKDYFNFAFIKYGLIAIIFSGFTEHRWTAPAEVLPYILYLSILLIIYAREKNEKNIIY